MNGLKFIKGAPVDVDAEVKKGSLIMLEFWATWCPPCKASIPHLTSLQRKFKNDLTVIGITTEDERTIQPFVNSMGANMDYRVAIDERQSVYSTYMGGYNVSGIPHAFLISNGKVQWHGHPMQRETEAEIEKCIKELKKIDYKTLTKEQLTGMSIKDLKQILAENNVSIVGLLEKPEFVDKILSLPR